MTRKALGRGLSALLGDQSEVADATLQDIPLDRIDPNPFQPRRAFSADRINELAESIRATGVVQPVVLRRADARYQLIAGERRWRAAGLAGLAVIPSLVRDFSDRDALEIALTENVLREDLGPLEVARAYETLQEQFGYSQDQIAGRLGLNRSTVANTLRLLKLPSEIQNLLDEKKISAGHARALLSCPDEESQRKLALAIVGEGLSVRQAERLAGSRPLEGHNRVAAIEDDKVDPNVRAAIQELERTLGTRVRVSGSSERGKIEISFYSGQDLNRIFDLIVRR
ncbi:MAG: ParB/RepB/Spo0J family partition protein [Acidobacteriota bacterium]|nr:ParB/RepB/Spo0J family partition protein [Acidobacteriota bacterium]